MWFMVYWVKSVVDYSVKCYLNFLLKNNKIKSMWVRILNKYLKFQEKCIMVAYGEQEGSNEQGGTLASCFIYVEKEFLMGLQIVFTCLGFSMSFGGKEILSRRGKPCEDGDLIWCVHGHSFPAIVVSGTQWAPDKCFGLHLERITCIFIIYWKSRWDKNIYRQKITGVQTRSRGQLHLALKVDPGSATFCPSLLPIWSSALGKVSAFYLAPCCFYTSSSWDVLGLLGHSGMTQTWSGKGFLPQL